MRVRTLSHWMDVDKIIELAEHYKALGPFIGVLLPFLESFLPFLPLFVFVFANAGAYGLWLGLILSWIGTVTGSYAVFLLIRKYGRNRLLRFITKRARIQQLIGWVERNGFAPLFLLLCFPFTPSALINIVAGLSNMRKTYYLFTLIAGKLVMIFTISFIGYDLKALLTQPTRTAVVILLIALLWFVGKWLEKRLNEKVKEDFRSFSGSRRSQEKRL